MESFKLDLQVAKQNALHDWTLEFVEQVLLDKDKKRTKKEKYDLIKTIILDAIESEEKF